MHLIIWLIFPPSLSLAQLPLTDMFSFFSSPALYCHSSSMSFSFPSTWHSICLGVLLCPVETNSDKPCDEKAGSSFTTLCLVSIHANPWTQSKWCVFMNWPSKMLEAVQQTIYLIFKPFVICVFLVFWCVLLSQSKLFSYGRFLVTTRRTQV